MYAYNEYCYAITSYDSGLESGDYGDVGKCLFDVNIYFYKMDADLHKKIQAIHYSNFRGSILFDKPLIDKYGIKNITNLKKKIKKEFNWFK